jgi:hypothetical protein
MLEYFAVWFAPVSGEDVDYVTTLQLKQFMATPLLVYNNQFLDQPGNLPLENLNKTAAFVLSSYQVPFKHFCADSRC